ncbi:MAG: TIGR03790 family protein [Nitrospirales bacterium]
MCAFFSTPVYAELGPNQIVIVSNKNSQESESVAKHYVSQRGIPKSHVLALDISTKETISREEYEQAILHPIRESLESRKLASTVRVLVTTYGIPLRVKASRPSPQEKSWVEDAKAWKKSSVLFLEELKTDIEQVGILESQSSSPPKSTKEDQQGIESLLQQFKQAIPQAFRRLNLLEDSKRQKAHDVVMQKILQRLYGLSGKIQILQHAAETTGTVVDRPLANIRAQLRSAEQVVSILQANPSERTRERVYQVVQQYFGVVGVLHLANNEIQRFSFTQADASVDSELSLLWWDQAYAHPSGKLPNPLYAWYPQPSRGRAFQPPVMMVSRLDAPTADLTKQLIDHAILAEQKGLRGKAYFDARGMDSDQPLSYGHYDRDIRSLSDAVRQTTSYPVVLENTQKRFDAPGEAPDVALYVGWYRLRHYEDAFTFNPGSIGYHIASGEAVSLHDHIERGWCKNALERGITVTLGPIGEPYLDAFPLPSEFFGLLLTGRYSLVEAFYLSSRYVSWRMVLIGDPLYNPWKGKELAKKVKASGLLKLQTLPVPPSEGDFLDPIPTRKQLQEERARVLSKLSLKGSR